MTNNWREIDSGDWPTILEAIDPDWTDHFVDAEQGLEFYDKYPEEYGPDKGKTQTQIAVALTY